MAPSFLGDATGSSTGGSVILDKEANLNVSNGLGPSTAPVVITVTSTPNNGFQSVTLTYTNNNFSTSTPVTMTLTSQTGGVDTWTATIPAQTAGTTVRFFLDGLDWDGTTHDFNPGGFVNYTYVTVALTVSFLSGVGTVTSTPAGISCSTGNTGTCSASSVSSACTFSFTGGNVVQSVSLYAALDDTTGGVASAPDASNGSLDPPSVTLEAWGKLTLTTATTNSHISLVTKGQPFASGVSANGIQLGYFFDGTSFFPEFTADVAGATVPDLVACRAAAAISPNTTHHFAGTYDSNTLVLRLFVDGVQACTASYTGPLNGDGGETGAPFWFGTSTLFLGSPSTATDKFKGVLDEVRLSNIARYAGTFTPVRHPANDANTLGLYHVDEGTGTTAVDASGHVNAALSGGAGFTLEP
jgi:hypothetical protein